MAEAGGFGPRALDFFRALAFHQDRDWFGENRALSDTDDLTRAPRGHEGVGDPALARALRHRHLIVRLPLEPEALRRAGLVGALADFAGAAMPLLAFGRAALEGLDPRSEGARPPR